MLEGVNCTTVIAVRQTVLSLFFVFPLYSQEAGQTSLSILKRTGEEFGLARRMISVTRREEPKQHPQGEISLLCTDGKYCAFMQGTVRHNSGARIMREAFAYT